ncbi:MAG TPA: hypothetical protein VKE49_08120, partial [Myxococcaceae bacterium]|nr:hypothetical protein [Myxococcaceae bacterium]
QSAAFVSREGSPEMEIFVPLAGVIDLAEERARLAKEISRADADIAAVARKLENPNFASKAPMDVVEKERQRAEDLEVRRAKLQENLNRIR